MKNILITGGLGFIGRTLTGRLLLEGQYNVHIIDIRELPKELSGRVNYQQLDITDCEALTIYFNQHSFDGIIHLAAISRVEDAEKDKEKCIRVNYGGTKNIVDNIYKHDNIWMIFGSSREVYGEQKKQPVNEFANLCPMNVYGHTKLEGELLTEKLNKYIILRFSNVYGNCYDRQERVIPIFLRRALNNEDLILHGGEQIIDFTYIDDTIDAIISSIHLCEEKNDIHEHILVSPGEKNSLLSVAQIIVEMTSSKSHIVIDYKNKRSYDVETFIGNNIHRKKTLLDREFISVKDGLLRLIEHNKTRT